MRSRTDRPFSEPPGKLTGHFQLEQGGIKLTSVVTDLFGVSGWAMLQRLARGETGGAALAAETRGVWRKKTPAPQEAPAGRLDPIYQRLLQQNLEQVSAFTRSDFGDQGRVKGRRGAMNCPN